MAATGKKRTAASLVLHVDHSAARGTFLEDHPERSIHKQRNSRHENRDEHRDAAQSVRVQVKLVRKPCAHPRDDLFVIRREER